MQLHVYELAVVETKPIHINLSNDWHMDQISSDIATHPRKRRVADDLVCRQGESRHFKTQQQPPLAATCTAVRQEVRKIYYKCNVFEANYHTAVQRDVFYTWLKMIGPENYRQVKALYMCSPLDRWDELRPEALAELRLELMLSGAKINYVTVEKGNRHRVAFNARSGHQHMHEYSGLRFPSRPHGPRKECAIQ